MENNDTWNELVSADNIYPSPNFNSRFEIKITHIIIHITGGDSFSSAKNWLINPIAEASAHYIIKKDGVITQLVKDKDKAWHAGIFPNEITAYDKNNYDWLNLPRTKPDLWKKVHPGRTQPINYENSKSVNSYSIGIETVGGTFQTAQDYKNRAKIINSLVTLIRNLILKYDIQIDKEHILGHEDVNPIARWYWDPGPGFDWDDLISRLKPSINFPTDIPKSPTPPLHWYHKSEASPGGFYPVGKNRCVHGGVHLCSGDAVMPVRSIAPGYVAACRFFSMEKEEDFKAEQAKKLALEDDNAYFVDPSYSGFILIRHDIKPNTENNDEIIPLYSLFMNLAPPGNRDNEQVPWFEALKKMITGGSTSTAFPTAGNFSWGEQNEGPFLFRKARKDNEPFSKITLSESGIPLVDDAEGKVITFSENLFPVEGGEIVGISKKMTGETANFVHWELFSPQNDNAFDKLKELYEGSLTLQELNESDNYLAKEELSSIYAETSFQEFMDMVMVTTKLDWSQITQRNYLTRINPYIDPAVFDEKSEGVLAFYHWLPLLFYKRNTYEIAFKVQWSDQYEIDNEKNLTLKCAAGSFTTGGADIFLKGEKSGTNVEFFLPLEDQDTLEGDEESVTFTLGELKNGITLKLPGHAKHLVIEQDGSAVEEIKIEQHDTEKNLFETTSKQNMRDVKLIHKPEWTDETMQKLFDTLKEKEVLKEADYDSALFEEITWLDSDKEHHVYDSLFASGGLIPADSQFTHFHPATCLWLLKLLIADDKIRFDTTRRPAEFEKENKIKHFAYITDSVKSAIPLGDTVKLLLIAEEIRPDKESSEIKLPKDEENAYTIAIDKYGQWCQPIPINYWGEYESPVEGVEFMGGASREGVLWEKFSVEKPVITALSIEQGAGPVDLNNEEAENPGKLILTLENRESSLLFIPGLLYFQYSKQQIQPKPAEAEETPESENEDTASEAAPEASTGEETTAPGSSAAPPESAESSTADESSGEPEASQEEEEWTEFDHALLVGASSPEPGALWATINPKDIYREILEAVGPLTQGEKIALKIKFLTPNGGLPKIDSAMSREKAVAGSLILEKGRSHWNAENSSLFPGAEDFTPLTDTLLLPSLLVPENPALDFPDNTEKLYLCTGKTEFGNESYKWMTKEDFQVSAMIKDHQDGTVKETVDLKPHKIIRKKSKYYLQAVIEPAADFFSSDKTKPNKLCITCQYPVNTDEPLVKTTIPFPLENPEIVEIAAASNAGTGEITITGVKKNIPSWLNLKAKIEWQGSDSAGTNVSWIIFLDETSGGAGQNVTFKIPADKVSSSQFKLSFIPINLEDPESFPANLEHDDPIDLEASGTQFKTKTIVEAGGYASVWLRENARYAAKKLLLLNNGTPVRAFLDNENNPISQNEGNVTYYLIEYTDTNKKNTYTGWIFASRIGD